MESLHQIRVGKYDYKSKTPSRTDGYTTIIIHPGKGDTLSPYALRTPKGYLLENVLQFSKIYPFISDNIIYSYIPGNRGKVLIWDHQYEKHIDDGGIPTSEYWNWRNKGFNNKYAVRYPNGYDAKQYLKGFYWTSGGENYKHELLDIVTARKVIYCREYIRSIRDEPFYLELVSRYRHGEKLQIVAEAGPDWSEEFPFNTMKKGEIGESGVNSMEATHENVVSVLNNRNKPFGKWNIVHQPEEAMLLLDRRLL